MTGAQYARGTKAWGLCKRCGLRFLLDELVLDEHMPGLRVCVDCFDTKQPQEFPVDVSDPQALWKPSPEDNFTWAFDIPALDDTFTQGDYPMTAALNANGIGLELQDSAVFVVGSTKEIAKTGTYTPQIPAGLAAGDLLIWFIQTPTAPGNAPTYDPAGWSRLNRFPASGNPSSANSSSVNQNMAYSMIYWRRAPSSGYTMPSFTWATAHTYHVIAVRNVHTVAPFRNFTKWSIDNQAVGSAQGLLGCILSNSQAMRLLWQCQMGGSVGTFDRASGPVPEFDVATDLGAGGVGERFSGLGFASNLGADATNLFLATRQSSEIGARGMLALAGTPVGASVNGDDNAIDASHFSLHVESTAANSRHYVPWSVNLTAGQRYTIVLDAGMLNSTTNNGALSVYDGTTEYGSTYAFATGIAAGANIGAGFAGFYSANRPGNGITWDAVGMIFATFTAAVTGPHEIRVGYCDSANNLTHVGSSADDLYINHLGIYSGYGAPRPLSGPAKTSEYAPLAPIYTHSTGGAGVLLGHFSWEFPHTSYNLPVKWCPFDTRNAGARLDSTELGVYYDVPNANYQTGVGSGTKTLTATDPVWSPNVITGVTGKYYFEVTIGSVIGTPLLNTGTVGVVTPDQEISEAGVNGESSSGGTLNTDASSSFGCCCYNRRGELYDFNDIGSGFTQNGVGTFTTGDIIGVAIDLTGTNGSVQFYKNGIAVGSAMQSTLSALPHLAAFNVGGSLQGFMGGIANFAGPFGGRKPVGYSAYDYLHEVA